ncbi:lipopolysaccharide heptosyltransferase family protein, partial [Myxococcota bacterium]|nr:lipopolysaccharide heptosyltransferase family protein [Myxococcota bacterium]
MKLLKLLERVGRRFLIHLAGLLFASRQRKITLSSEPSILVVRLDERIGNLVLTTPLLSSLKERFPHSK